MRYTWRDGAATLLVAAIVVPYIGYLTRGELPFVHDPRGLAAVGLVLGLAACAVGGSAVDQRHPAVRVASGLGVTALVLGIATFVTESELLLAAFVATIVLLWALATVRHLVSGRAPAEPVGSDR